jgi:hypothetical protein
MDGWMDGWMGRWMEGIMEAGEVPPVGKRISRLMAVGYGSLDIPQEREMKW